MLEVKTDNSIHESLFPDEKPKANNRSKLALDRKGSRTRLRHADNCQSGPCRGDSQPSVLKGRFIKPLTIVHVMGAHASVASSKPEEELDSHADTCVVGDKCSVIHDHNRPVNVCSCDPIHGHRSTKTVDATVGYQDQQNGQKFILMITKLFIFMF